MPALDQERLEKNLALMKARFPRVYRQMVEVKSASTIVGGEDGVPLNLDLGHTMFYEGGVDRFLEEQYARYAAKPDRLNLTLPEEPRAVTRIPHIVQRGIFRHFKAENIRDVHMLPREKAGFMIVFGLGLGLHLNWLVENYEFRHLVVIEQFPEFVYHSLYFVDWVGIVEKIEANGGRLSFFISEIPTEIGQTLYWYLRSADFGLIDGSYVYRHYSSFFIDGAFESFKEQLPLQLVSKGFFEDEIIMMRNTFENLITYDFSLLDPKNRLAKNVPALVVGSGPSIDRSFDLIRSLRDKVLLISCGTTLRVLLRNGIVPHYHCELENVPAVFEHLEPLSQEYDLSPITLVATTTVDPRVPGLFGKRMLYFRDALSSTLLFGNEERAIFGGAPNVSNLATRISIALGFRQVYMIGVDLGSRKADVHHAKDAVYNKEWTKTYTRLIEPMKIALPGNFGGRAYTNTVLLWARSMLEGLIKEFPDREFFNCSDGVRLPGTTPCLPAHLAARSASFPSNAETLRQIPLEVKQVDPRGLLDRDRLVEVTENFRLWREDMAAMTAAAREEGWDFLTLYDAVVARISRNGKFPDAQQISSIVLGSMMMILQFAYFFAHRLDPELRPGFMAELLDRLDESVDKMADEAIALFEGFVTRLDQAAA